MLQPYFPLYAFIWQKLALLELGPAGTFFEILLFGIDISVMLNNQASISKKLELKSFNRSKIGEK